MTEQRDVPRRAARGAEPALIYLGRGRLDRRKANLIQTLHTVAAFERIGHRVELCLPWVPQASVDRALYDIGITTSLEIHRTLGLRTQPLLDMFLWASRDRLRSSPAVYTRVPSVSMALIRHQIPHHLEVHEPSKLEQTGLLRPLAEAHRRGLIGQFVLIARNAIERMTKAGADPSRICVARSAVDFRAFAEVPPLRRDALARPRLGYFGRISSSRGLAVLEHLAQQPHCDVILVGRTTGRRPPRIVYQPPVPHRDVPRLYHGIDVVLLPYQTSLGYADSLSPVKLYEAMAAGRPIIASDLPVLEEVIEHERTGLLVPPDDLHAWVEAVGRLRRDPALALRLAVNAREEARHRDWTDRARLIAEAIGLPPADA